MIVAQFVVVDWTKRSRGAPGAAVRNAVPEAFRLPPLPPADVVVHDVWADEAGGFVPEEKLTADAQGRMFRFAVVDGRVAVRLLSTAVAGYSAWGTPQVVLRVAPGTWSRVVWNRRYASTSSEWRYRKFVLNVAWWQGLDGPPPLDLFVATAPARTVDRQDHLF